MQIRVPEKLQMMRSPYCLLWLYTAPAADPLPSTSQSLKSIEMSSSSFQQVKTLKWLLPEAQASCLKWMLQYQVGSYIPMSY